MRGAEMRYKKLPPQEYLRQRFDYDPETGDVTWKPWLDKLGRPNTKTVGKTVGTLQSNGYRTVILDEYKKLWLHRVIWKWVHGADPDGEIDHIDHNRVNNRLSNLRVVERRTNTRNQSLHARSTSGVTGISWDEKNQKWRAHIAVDGRFKCLGRYVRKEHAEMARDRANKKYGYHENHGKPLEPESVP